MGLRRQSARAADRRGAPDRHRPRQGDGVPQGPVQGRRDAPRSSRRRSRTCKVQGTPTFVIDGKVYGGELSHGRSRRDLEAAGEVRACDPPPLAREGSARSAVFEAVRAPGSLTPGYSATAAPTTPSPAAATPPGERARGDDDQRRERIPARDEQRRIVGAIGGVDRRRDARRRRAGERAGQRRDSAARPRAARRSARPAAGSTAAGSASGSAASCVPTSRVTQSSRRRHDSSTTTAPPSSTNGATSQPRPARPAARRA